jgi:hypothetical protein
MRLPWRREARPIEPKPMVGLKILELQTAKEILSEVFYARPSDVEEGNLGTILTLLKC